jgi:hypothetical protein
MGLLLLVVVLLLLFGSLPRHSYSSNWGYRPAGLMGALLVLVVVLAVLGSIPWGFNRPVYVTNPRPVVIDRRPITVINPAPVGQTQGEVPPNQ